MGGFCHHEILRWEMLVNGEISVLSVSNASCSMKCPVGELCPDAARPVTDDWSRPFGQAYPLVDA